MILGAVTQANWTAWVRFPAARVKDAHVYSGPGAHHRISLTPSPLLRRGEREIFPAHLWWQYQEAPEWILLCWQPSGNSVWFTAV